MALPSTLYNQYETNVSTRIPMNALPTTALKLDLIYCECQNINEKIRGAHTLKYHCKTILQWVEGLQLLICNYFLFIDVG